MASKRNNDPADGLLADLAKGKEPEEIIGAEDVLKQRKERLVECVLETAMTDHLGNEPHAAEEKNAGNSSNGVTQKTVSATLAHRGGGGASTMALTLPSLAA